MPTPVTQASLTTMLNNPNPQYVNVVIGRALVALFQKQTEEEKSQNTTKVHNGVGFTPADGFSGTVSAKYFLKHGKLEQWQREMWMKPNKSGVPRLVKYAGQLNKIAIRKYEDAATSAAEYRSVRG
jgi:hypothetical protein